MGFRYEHEEDGEKGVDDWLMTYADLITLLLCFFAIILSVSVPKTAQMLKAEQQMKEEFSGMSKAEIEASLKGSPSILPFDSMPSIVGTQGHKGEGEVEPDNSDRITTMEMDSSLFFASGSSQLSDAGKTALKELVPRLQSEFSDYQITIEGHTDDSPIKTLQFPSNWELSAARASAVVRFYIEEGITATRLRAAGYADAFPKAPNRDGAGNPIPENQAANRRVVIKLEKIG